MSPDPSCAWAMSDANGVGAGPARVGGDRTAAAAARREAAAPLGDARALARVTDCASASSSCAAVSVSAAGSAGSCAERTLQATGGWRTGPSALCLPPPDAAVLRAPGLSGAVGKPKKTAAASSSPRLAALKAAARLAAARRSASSCSSTLASARWRLALAARAVRLATVAYMSATAAAVGLGMSPAASGVGGDCAGWADGWPAATPRRCRGAHPNSRSACRIKACPLELDSLPGLFPSLRPERWGNMGMTGNAPVAGRRWGPDLGRQG